jgi:hypothetical protein
MVSRTTSLLDSLHTTKTVASYSTATEILVRARCRCTSAIRARPAFVLGPVDSPPWNRQRRFPGTTLMMHGAPALVLAQHLGRNLRFKGSPVCDRPHSASADTNAFLDRLLRDMRVRAGWLSSGLYSALIRATQGRVMVIAAAASRGVGNSPRQ